MNINIEYLNKWFNELNHHDKVILMAGYKNFYKIPKDEYFEMDDSDDNFKLLWDKNNEFDKLDLYCNYLNINIESVNIDDKEKFYFLPYEDKIKYLNLDSNLLWENNSLNKRYEQLKALG